MEHPKEFADTDPRVMEIWLETLRAKTPAEKLAMTLAMTEAAMKMSESGVRARYPNALEREIFLRSAALRIPGDLMIRAYGWDPETDFVPEPEQNP